MNLQNGISSAVGERSALDRARRKAYWRLLPILFACYMIAYIDRVNVSVARLQVSRDLPAFNDDVIGTGAGVFFLGYFLLEIPGTLLVEKWSARKWICRIMVTWGIVAALTAWAITPHEFYFARFMLGLAEAGFFPGVIVYLTHWFTARDRTRALAWFLTASTMAQIVSPKISGWLLDLGTLSHPGPLGLAGWQWMYIFWGIPAMAIGMYVLWFLPDQPELAPWLSADEKIALRSTLETERQNIGHARRLTLAEAMSQPKVLLLTAAYFCIMAGNYGIDFFMPSILQDWYSLKIDQTTWLIIIGPLVALAAIIFVGWNSDRTRERHLHAAIPCILAGIAVALMPATRGHFLLTMLCYIIIAPGIKAYMAPFWSLPSLFLTEVAAAGSVGLINSVGNLGGYVGPKLVGMIKHNTGSYAPGLFCLSTAMILYGAFVLVLRLVRSEDHLNVSTTEEKSRLP